VCPAYGSVKVHGPRTARPEPLGVDVGNEAHWARTWETTLPGSQVPVYLLEHDGFFSRPDVYSAPGVHTATTTCASPSSRAARSPCASSSTGFPTWFTATIGRPACCPFTSTPH
jgi:starch synthase